ncbi:ABC transporter ATP-binding protein [Crossiella cryophila]|uniref:ABC-2 type transport system ATP-binding protein n=1 Tax=Crossiella cryophila TaxID=43355 RepID=A0A7W7CA26_9PSEU|nr:ABC transporter ATP-binding protein [Crossiella cryophila]MBB4677308.1 ABC-2 type transport system ATP-binding protein [Crossiella cryophila]
MNGNVIEVEDLHYRYGEFAAVRGIDFTVRRGETFALLGTNGAGKTTTLEVIEGFRKPAKGRVRVLGLDPHADRYQVQARTGVMLQNAGLIEELTVAETLRLWQRLSSRTDKVATALSRVDLAHKSDVQVDKLSGGERRRLDFAISTWGAPELVVLDEPTTGLDPESRQRLWARVGELKESGSTILLTTHYLEEAEALADQVTIMHNGVAQISGTLHEVLSGRPATITADLPAHAPALPTLHGSTTVDGNRIRVETLALQADLTTLLNWAGQHRLELENLNASPASLHEVFLATSEKG